MISQLKEQLLILRQAKPLVLNLTNYVSMEFVANSLLALGAAPMMSEDLREIEELVYLSNSLYVNIGTLNADFIERAKLACHFSKQYKKPIIFDPVGAGVSKARMDAVQEILPFIDIIRGNASEIIAVCNCKTMLGLGVESTDVVEDAVLVARELVKNHDVTIVISGEQDIVINHQEEVKLSYGSPIMTLVTGMGCSLTAVIAAFRANMSNSFEAAKIATCYFTLSGQVTAQENYFSGSFKNKFIDNLNHPDWKKISKIIGEN